MEDIGIEWPHSHSFFSFVWFTHGSGFYVVDSEEYDIKPQRVFYVAPKQVHNWSLYDGTQGHIIFIDQQTGLEMNLTYGFPYIDVDDTDILFHTSIIENIRKELSNENKAVDDESIKAGLKYYSHLLYQIAKKKQIKERMDWFGNLLKQHKVADKGNTLSPTGAKTIYSDKSVASIPYSEGEKIVTGYIVVQTETIEEAVEIAKANPILKIGGSVEVREIIKFIKGND